MVRRRDNETAVSRPFPASPMAIPPAETRYRYAVVGILALVFALSFLDRQLLSVLAEPIKGELDLSDTQLGLLSGPAFAIFYTGFGIPLGRLADKTNRVRLVAISCAIWSLFCVGCGLSGSFMQLAFARLGVGVGEAGGSPPAHAIISDYFPKHERGLALALYSLGVPFGMSLGMALGGWIAAEHGWRIAFIAVGSPGVLIAAMVLLTVREPRRGRYDGAVETSPPLRDTIRLYLDSPAMLLTASASGCSAFVCYATLSWVPALLIRAKGMTLSEVALYYSFVTGTAVAIGGLASGIIVDRLGTRQPAAYALVPAAAFLVALPFFVGAILSPTWQWTVALVAIPCVMQISFYAPALAVVQNVTPAAQRATASAILLFIINLIGIGGGPVYVGVISDLLRPSYGPAALEIALLTVSPFFVIAVAAHYLAGQALKKSALRNRIAGQGVKPS